MSGDVVDGELSLKTRFSVTCTVSINNKAVCVHDDVWKRCKVSLDFLRLMSMLDSRETGRVHCPRFCSPD